MFALLRYLPAIALFPLFLTSCRPPSYEEKFSALANEFIYTSLANSPVAATQAGYHRHGSMELDSILDDFGPAALEKQRRWYQDFRLRIDRSIDAKTLTPEDRVDLSIIENQISLALLELQTIRNHQHDPTMYVEQIGNALYAPFVLEYASKEKRYEHIVNRLSAVPRFLQQARLNLRSAPAVWTRVAIAENDGNVTLIDEELRGQAPMNLRSRYDEAATAALESIHNFTRFLEMDLQGRDYDWRLGREKYAQKFRYTIATDQSVDQVLQAAEREMQQTRDEMYRLAARLANGQPVSRNQNTAIKRALEQIAERHASPETYFTDARRDLAEARQFVRDKDLLTLPPRDNLQVIETPEFMRGIYSVGGFNSAPALEPQLGAFYWLTPISSSLPKESIESKLREYNYYGLKLLTIHEAMPGHYVQFEYANQVQPPLRRILRGVFGNGPYIEGWAVYATELLLEQGYLNHSPELRLSFLKHQLRVLANTILDVRLHTKGMTDQEALDLMINDAFQEREEAIGKLQRAKLSSTQLPTYFVGFYDWRRLRDRVQESKGNAFSLKEFHESALGAGAVPLPALSRLLAGEPLSESGN